MGYQRCGSFGDDWNVAEWPRLTFGMSISGRSTVISELEIGSHSEHFDKQFKYDLKGRDIRPSERAGFLLFDTRIGGYLMDYLYTGVELSVGAGSSVNSMRTEELLWVRPGSMTYVGFGAVLGGTLPLADFQLRGELLTGFRALILEVETQYGDCINTESFTELQFALEPRVALDYWATEWLTVGAFVGMDVIDLGSLYGGIGLELHAIPYDGMRSF